MWRHFLNFTCTTLTNFHKISSRIRNCIPLTQVNGFRTVFILTTVGAAVKSSAEKDRGTNLNFLTEVQKACCKNDNALKELMQVLASCITEISKEYQKNIELQIEIINKCTKVGPVGPHWDELTKYRVHATELKEELSKYETLAQKVGQMAYNQAITSLLSGVENAMDLVEVDYGKLESLLIQLAKDNYQWEAKLLYANRDSILTALK